MLKIQYKKRNTSAKNNNDPYFKKEAEISPLKYKFVDSTENLLNKAFDILFEEVMKNELSKSYLTPIDS